MENIRIMITIRTKFIAMMMMMMMMETDITAIMIIRFL